MLLVKAVNTHPDKVILRPKIVDYSYPDTIQHSETFVYYTGKAILVNSHCPASPENPESDQFHPVSGMY
jgi:hypothetical protein